MLPETPNEDVASTSEVPPAICVEATRMSAQLNRHAGRVVLGKSVLFSTAFHAMLASALWFSWSPFAKLKIERGPQIVIEAGVASLESQRSIASVAVDSMKIEPPKEEPLTTALAPSVPELVRKTPEPPSPPKLAEIDALRTVALPVEVERTPPKPMELAPEPPVDREIPRPPKKPIQPPSIASAESVASVKSTGIRVDKPPTLRANPAPEYPAEARRLRLEGLVELWVLVGTDGRARQVVLHQSSGSEELDQAAMETVRERWQFQPAMNQTIAVELAIIVPVRFQIRD
jgi:protein TonB